MPRILNAIVCPSLIPGPYPESLTRNKCHRMEALYRCCAGQGRSVVKQTPSNERTDRVGSGRWADFESCSRIHACGFRCFCRKVWFRARGAHISRKKTWFRARGAHTYIYIYIYIYITFSLGPRCDCIQPESINIRVSYTIYVTPGMSR
jgi:hypothetical protein